MTHEHRRTATAIYTRISADTDGNSLGVARQEAEMRQVYESKGLDVVAVFTDNDVSASAYSKKTRRSGYAKLLEAIKANEVDVVAVWDLDRLCRRPAEQEQFYLLADAAGMGRIVTRGEDYNLAESLVLPRVKAAIAAEEGRKQSARLKAKHRQLVEAGQPNGGPRPFGLTDIKRRQDGTSYRDIEPVEADALRAAAEAVLSGTTLHAVLRDWTARGIKPTGGAVWTHKKLSRILQSEYTTGRRKGYKATWPAIVDDETFRLLGGLFASRVTGTAHQKSLLSGIARCSLCGHGMVSRGRDWKQSHSSKYRCPGDRGGCGHVSINGDGLDADIAARVLSAVDAGQRPAVEDDHSEAAKAEAELAKLETVKANLLAMVGSGDLDLDSFKTAKQTNDRRMSELGAIIAKDAERAATKRVRAQALDMRAQWEQLDTEQRRQLILAIVEKVTVEPGIRGRNTYDMDRVTVSYR